MKTLPSSLARWYSGSEGISGGAGEHSISMKNIYSVCSKLILIAFNGKLIIFNHFFGHE